MRSVGACFFVAALVVVGLGAACSAGGKAVSGDRVVQASDEAEAPGEYAVQFRDRVVDLEPYVQGFPYSSFRHDLEGARMLFFETTPEGKWLNFMEVPEEGLVDLKQARRVHDIDWSKRSFYRGEFHAPSQKYLFVGDERNDERLNVYSLDPESGDLEALTNVDYVYGMSLSTDHSLLGYVARHGTAEPFNSCLMIRDMETGEERKVLCDDGGKDRFTWTGVDFAPSMDYVVVRVQHDGDRSTTNLAKIDLDAEEPAFEFLLERGVKHFSLSAIKDTLDDDGLVFFSARSGFGNLYRYNSADAQTARLTNFKDDTSSATFFERGESDDGVILVVLQRPYESELVVLDPRTGETLHSEVNTSSMWTAGTYSKGGSAVFVMSSVGSPFRMERVQLEEGVNEGVGISRSLVAAVPEDTAEKLIQCVVERVSFPTFDTLEDGSQRMLHAYLLTPQDEPAPEDRFVRMTSFYGGGNYFSTESQIMCEAGVATFSPSPRGSRGFGAEFEALNDGDLGGDEIIDLFYGARWLEANKGYSPRQIGVHGGSHGGYAAMRALTFPPHTNDRNESYDFGFGMSHAGFSDIISFYEKCNIPDWVILEAGDPATEADKLRDRSPLYHVELLKAPMLLTHGENDSRVPVEESRRFSARAQELGRPVTYVEFAGQGHGIDGLENRLHYYRVLFNFLTEVDQRNSSHAP